MKMRRVFTDEEKLVVEAEELGVTLAELESQSGIGKSIPELQKRVLAARREYRDARAWYAAIASAVASIISAATALVAVLCAG